MRGEEVLEVRKMTEAEAEENFRKLTEYYYNNSRACSCMENFRISAAEDKIRSMIAHLHDGTAIVYGCFDGLRLCGYLWAYEIQFREEHRIYVSEIYVEESCRGQGLGTLLLDAAEDEAKKRGIPALYIHAEADNTGAVRLYERFGFSMERVQMRKVLSGQDYGTGK